MIRSGCASPEELNWILESLYLREKLHIRAGIK
jgi:hypothetical protein